MQRRFMIFLPALFFMSVTAVSNAVSADDVQVTIDNFTFSPPTIAVPVGTTVTWTNRDDIPHTVTDTDHPKDIRSHPLDTGDVYSRTFTTSGTFRYFCSLHPHMQGTVVVK